jgi:hypothetical protein
VIGSPEVTPRDFDFVVAGVTVEALETVFAEHVRRRTRFGGLHLVVEGVPFDVWPLEQTWAFKARPGEQASFAALPHTTFLNVEGVAVEMTGPEAGTIHEGGFFEAVLSRTLEIDLALNPSPLECVWRSLVTAARLEFALGPQLTRYIAAHGAALRAEDLAEAQQAHLGCRRWDADDFRRWLDALRAGNAINCRAAHDLRSLARRTGLVVRPPLPTSGG